MTGSNFNNCNAKTYFISFVSCFIKISKKKSKKRQRTTVLFLLFIYDPRREGRYKMLQEKTVGQKKQRKTSIQDLRLKIVDKKNAKRQYRISAFFRFFPFFLVFFTFFMKKLLFPLKHEN